MVDHTLHHAVYKINKIICGLIKERNNQFHIYRYPEGNTQHAQDTNTEKLCSDRNQVMFLSYAPPLFSHSVWSAINVLWQTLIGLKETITNHFIRMKLKLGFPCILMNAVVKKVLSIINIKNYQCAWYYYQKHKKVWPRIMFCVFAYNYYIYAEWFLFTMYCIWISE